ncbi:hypothetical protein PROFUN_05371 [Planoprotostelium fungivorum]|uniref:Uncharacterized protein n=1 Tax=Planoprotostelium fungivorum TaxID=1890364 RepID=A0A2P6NR58_9EUKA|nr:hypothetical protein PROFUN_05371 [Planoprotostelium fungivorum]
MVNKILFVRILKGLVVTLLFIGAGILALANLTLPMYLRANAFGPGNDGMAIPWNSEPMRYSLTSNATTDVSWYHWDQKNHSSALTICLSPNTTGPITLWTSGPAGMLSDTELDHPVRIPLDANNCSSTMTHCRGTVYFGFNVTHRARDDQLTQVFLSLMYTSTNRTCTLPLLLSTDRVRPFCFLLLLSSLVGIGITTFFISFLWYRLDKWCPEAAAKTERTPLLLSKIDTKVMGQIEENTQCEREDTGQLTRWHLKYIALETTLAFISTMCFTLLITWLRWKDRDGVILPELLTALVPTIILNSVIGWVFNTAFVSYRIRERKKNLTPLRGSSCGSLCRYLPDSDWFIRGKGFTYVIVRILKNILVGLLWSIIAIIPAVIIPILVLSQLPERQRSLLPIYGALFVAVPAGFTTLWQLPLFITMAMIAAWEKQQECIRGKVHGQHSSARREQEKHPDGQSKPSTEERIEEVAVETTAKGYDEAASLCDLTYLCSGTCC